MTKLFGGKPYKPQLDDDDGEQMGWEPVFDFEAQEGFIRSRITHHLPGCHQDHPAIVAGEPCDCPKEDRIELAKDWLAKIKRIGRRA